MPSVTAGGGKRRRVGTNRCSRSEKGLTSLPVIHAVAMQGKGAMGLKVIKPTWEQTGSGLKIAREGTVLLEFANALEKQKYDWENKQVCRRAGSGNNGDGGGGRPL